MKASARIVLDYLRAHPEGCTSRDAWLALGCSRLAARVDDLERLYGYTITSELINVESNGKKSRVALYKLREPVKPEQQSMGLVA